MTTIYGLLITDISRMNYTRIPAVLFASRDERADYIEIYSPQSWRSFQYDIEDTLATLDLSEGAPLAYPNL